MLIAVKYRSHPLIPMIIAVGANKDTLHRVCGATHGGSQRRKIEEMMALDGWMGE